MYSGSWDSIGIIQSSISLIFLSSVDYVMDIVWHQQRWLKFSCFYIVFLYSSTQTHWNYVLVVFCFGWPANDHFFFKKRTAEMTRKQKKTYRGPLPIYLVPYRACDDNGRPQKCNGETTSTMASNTYQTQQIYMISMMHHHPIKLYIYLFFLKIGRPSRDGQSGFDVLAITLLSLIVATTNEIYGKKCEYIKQLITLFSHGVKWTL